MLASHPLPRGDTAILQLCTASHIENVKHLQILPLDLRQNSPKFATVKPRVATHYIDDITGHAHTIIGAQVNQPRSTQLHTLRFPVPPLPGRSALETNQSSCCTVNATIRSHLVRGHMWYILYMYTARMRNTRGNHSAAATVTAANNSKARRHRRLLISITIGDFYCYWPRRNTPHHAARVTRPISNCTTSVTS